MSDRTLQRLTLLGALAFVAQGVAELIHTQGDPFSTAADYGIEAAFAVGIFGTLAGLLAFHRRAGSMTRFGEGAFRVAAGGQALLGLVVFATLVRGHDVLGPLFPLGVAGWLFGTIAYAVAVTRTKAQPTWQPVALAVGTIVGILLDPGGAIVLGLMWAALAMAQTVRSRPTVAVTATSTH